MRVLANDGWRGRIQRVACAMPVLAGLMASALTGCTVFPDKQPATLTMTTSAEQVARLFWQDVEQAKWAQANALLAPNAVWRVDGHVIPRADIVPWLQALGVHAIQLSDVALTPAVNDMNLVYTVQMQADKAVAEKPSASCAGQPQTLSALAVWQQPQPTGKPEKDKQYRGYLLTVQDLTVSSNAACH